MTLPERKRALICGVTGQDGAYLARLLVDKKYQVFGTSRDAHASSFANLSVLGVQHDVVKLSMAPSDFRSVMDAVARADPDEIYYLAGQSSVGLSFEQPTETLTSLTLGALNVLEAQRFLKPNARLYHASSSECFGDVGRAAADETFTFRPRSPYGVAKAAAHALVVNYREQHGLFAANGVLFNHESPLRPPRFVTRKIVEGALAISRGEGERLRLGRLDIERDWGWAPEYVEGMWRTLQAAQPDDFVIATGQSHSLETFTATVFERLGLDWRDHVDSDPALFRRTDIESSRGNPAKAGRVLGWKARYGLAEVVDGMIEGLSHR